MIQIVTKLKKYRYLIGSFLIIFGFVFGFYLNQKKESIYILYEPNFSECSNIDKYSKKEYFIICEGKRTILFKKIKNEPIKWKNLKYLKKVKITSKEQLLKVLSDSILFGSESIIQHNEYRDFIKKHNFYIILKDPSKKKLQIIHVGQWRFFS